MREGGSDRASKRASERGSEQASKQGREGGRERGRDREREEGREGKRLEDVGEEDPAHVEHVEQPVRLEAPALVPAHLL